MERTLNESLPGDSDMSSLENSAEMGGHLYMQTNETDNSVIHYVRAVDGTITEAERCASGGSGAGSLNFRSNPIGLIAEGAKSVILTPDRRLLFVTNVGDNSVSSFAVNPDGTLTLLNVKRTGNPVTGKLGTSKSLAYAASSRTLYVLHAVGPQSIRLMSVDNQGRLEGRPESYSAVPPDKPGRLTTMVVISPDDRFLLVGSSIDELPSVNPDGSPNLWIARNGKPHSIFPNNPDPDGLAVFPIGEGGVLGDPLFQDSGGSSPWCPLFLHARPNQLVIGYATADGVSLATLETDGTISTGPVVAVNTSISRPSALCWMAITPDDRLLFTTMTGYGYITSWRLDDTTVSIAKDPACTRVPGDGTFRGLNGVVSSGPTDMWMTPSGSFLYQIYPNASKLLGYKVHPDGRLEEVTSMTVPYNTSTGLAGF
jgi:6-phosphogluconolactonase (cycloisomerase 2 family)